MNFSNKGLLNKLGRDICDGINAHRHDNWGCCCFWTREFQEPILHIPSNPISRPVLCPNLNPGSVITQYISFCYKYSLDSSLRTGCPIAHVKICSWLRLWSILYEVCVSFNPLTILTFKSFFHNPRTLLSELEKTVSQCNSQNVK